MRKQSKKTRRNIEIFNRIKSLNPMYSAKRISFNSPLEQYVNAYKEIQNAIPPSA
jgi:hypothetical protein